MEKIKNINILDTLEVGSDGSHFKVDNKGNSYISATLQIGQETNQGYNFYVNGTSRFNGQTIINGSAGSLPLIVRGIVGSDGSGNIGDLHLQFGANLPIRLGNTAAYSISADGSQYSGNSASATKLTSSAGSTSKPVYFLDGKPAQCTLYEGPLKERVVGNWEGNIDTAPYGLYWVNLSKCSGSKPSTDGWGYLKRSENLESFTYYHTGETYNRTYANKQWYTWGNGATVIRDKTNNTASYLNYGASALSNPTYLAGWDGYTLKAVNRSNLSVNYANSAGNADTVDGYHIEYDNGYTSNDPAYICGFDTNNNKIKCIANGLISGTLSANYFIAANNQGLRVKNTSGTPIEIIYLNTSNETILPNCNVTVQKKLKANQGISINANQSALCFRDDNSGYYTDIFYGTDGNECLSFIAKSPDTSFMFVHGSDPAGWNSGTWTTVTPSMQIKKNHVAINYKWNNGVDPDFSLYVNGNTYIENQLNINSNIKITYSDDNYGIFPSANNYNQIGSSSLYWYKSYINNMYGKLFGNIGDDEGMRLYAHHTNEINFGGTSAATAIYFGYRAMDNKQIPQEFVFGGSAGNAVMKHGAIFLNNTGNYSAYGSGNISDYDGVEGRVVFLLV